MNIQSAVIPGSIIFTAEATTEPVSLAEAKTFLRVGYSSDDQLITDLIAAARQWAEEYTGLSIIQRTVSCTVMLGLIDVELPYGPLSAPYAPEVPDNVKFTPGEFPRAGGSDMFSFQYNTGFAIVPELIRKGICARIADTFENRGDTDIVPKSVVAKTYLSKYKRFMGWL